MRCRIAYDLILFVGSGLIIGPLTRPETAGSWVIILGILATLAFALLGYLFDGMEVKS